MFLPKDQACFLCIKEIKTYLDILLKEIVQK